MYNWIYFSLYSLELETPRDSKTIKKQPCHLQEFQIQTDHKFRSGADHTHVAERNSKTSFNVSSIEYICLIGRLVQRSWEILSHKLQSELNWFVLRNLLLSPFQLPQLFRIHLLCREDLKRDILFSCLILSLSLYKYKFWISLIFLTTEQTVWPFNITPLYRAY